MIRIIMNVKPNILNVSENGSIFILLGIDTIIADTYTFNCPIGIDCVKDRVTFTGSSISVKAEPNIGETKLAECIDYNVINGNPTFHYDACFGVQSNLDSCMVNSPFNTACREADPICFSSSTNLGFHIIPASSSKLDRAKGKYCWNDAGTLRSKNTPEVEYRICQSRQFHCISDAQYQDKCSINAAPDYVFATYTCPSGSLCDSSIDDEKADYGSKGLKLPNAPCSSVCNGNVQIITEDRNKNPMNNLLVSRDGVFSMLTNEVGVAEFSLTKTCGNPMEFTVKCQDNINLCGIKTTKFDVVNAYKSLLFDCSVCSSEKDLQIDAGDINVFESDKLVTAIVNLVGSLNAKDINITFRAQGKNGLISHEASQLFDLNSGDRFKVIYQNISLTDDDEFLHVSLDTSNKVSESNEKNNYAFFPLFKREISAYLEISTGFPLADNKIKNYLKQFVIEETDKDRANVILCVGQFCSDFKELNDYTLNYKDVKQKYGVIRHPII